MSDEKISQADSSLVTNASVPLIYHFCRLHLPAIVLSTATFQRHLLRTFELFRRKSDGNANWDVYLDNLYAVDWYLAVACLEGNAAAWEQLFAARAYRTDCLL